MPNIPKIPSVVTADLAHRVQCAVNVDYYRAMLTALETELHRAGLRLGIDGEFLTLSPALRYRAAVALMRARRGKQQGHRDSADIDRWAEESSADGSGYYWLDVILTALSRLGIGTVGCEQLVDSVPGHEAHVAIDDAGQLPGLDGAQLRALLAPFAVAVPAVDPAVGQWTSGPRLSDSAEGPSGLPGALPACLAPASDTEPLPWVSAVEA